MARINTIRKPDDHPAHANAVIRGDLATLFDNLFPGVSDPWIDEAHDGVAIAAHNPRLALQLANLSKFVALELGWCQRADLRELAIQTVNLHFNSEYSFNTRLKIAEAVGISAETLRAIPHWETDNSLSSEQKLVIAYSQAVAGGNVSDALFAQVVAAFGEQGAVEFTTTVALWSFWAMFLNATRPGP